MLKSLSFVLVVAASLAISGAVRAADGMIVKESAFGVEETLDRLEAAVNKAGAKVFARISHSGGAKSIGEKLEPTGVLIFGNPKLGTGLIQSSRSIGIDLPIRVMVWEEAGKTRLAYYDPAGLAQRHGVQGQDATIGRMTGALDKLSNAATKR